MSLGPSKRTKGPRKPVRGLGYLPEAVKARKPMKARRQDVRPGNKPMTEEEWAFIERAKTSGCVPCLIAADLGLIRDDEVFIMAGWDHKKSGNIRVGHLHGFANCNWHHQGLTIDREGWTHAMFRDTYGPSKAEGGRVFNDIFGSDDELIAYQRAHLAGEP